ncbi:MAG: hypothetical protein V7L31_18865 [Nostoc sp.]|uniref:hypothetical protein n=1 Tax=Nostoc sp. TaxID=1180 RepID=UPI002FF01EA2
MIWKISSNEKGSIPILQEHIYHCVLLSYGTLRERRTRRVRSDSVEKQSQDIGLFLYETLREHSTALRSQ